MLHFGDLTLGGFLVQGYLEIFYYFIVSRSRFFFNKKSFALFVESSRLLLPAVECFYSKWQVLKSHSIADCLIFLILLAQRLATWIGLIIFADPKKSNRICFVFLKFVDQIRIWQKKNTFFFCLPSMCFVDFLLCERG